MTRADDVATVDVAQPGRLVRIGPATINVNDVLELAEALIEEEGWRKTKGTGGPDEDRKAPWTIHHAIGEAARRATASAAKDSADARPLRDAAAEAVAEAHGGRTDIQLNDEDRCDQRRAIRILQHARGVGR